MTRWAAVVVWAVPAIAAAGTPAAGGDSDGESAVASRSTAPAGGEPTSSDESVPPIELAEEVVEVWGERPNKEFDRDTELRLTGEDLDQLGVVDLAEALEYVPELRVRALGRGGAQADIRGARKGAVKILIDGIPVDEPYYGTFDLSSIPVTDIEQIRVATSPSSPIDGAGGPGGVVEVHTRDAVGARMLRARGQGTMATAADASATARAGLGRGWAVRGSVAGALGARDYAVAMPDGTREQLDERRRALTAALRFEWRRELERRVTVDLSAQRRSFVPPPGDDASSDVLVVAGETAARAGASGDIDTGSLRVHARAYAHALARDSRYYADASLSDVRRGEHIDANRAGAGLVVNRPQTPWLHLVGAAYLDTEGARVEDLDGAVAGQGRSTVAQVAAGAQYERGGVRVDGAAGIATPIGLGHAPWPEAKLTLAWTPARPLTLEWTGARKGRVPTLRERYRTDIGNAELAPEMATFTELAVVLAPADGLSARVGGFVRATDGMIRYDGDRMQLVNVDDLVVRGVDARATVTRGRWRAVASWSFQDAYSPRFGSTPLDFLPQHRLWLELGAAVGRGGVRAHVRYEDDQVDRGATLAAHAELGVAAYARLGAGLLATVRVDNATDERYEIRQAVAAPGRSITLAVQWDAM
ncbi:MAG: TonB-dependent receptor [Deltaproteobacteria bacterium]|nr:MAG: TonB-dependent receptor [Deltaproteobacteria bacterium]